MPPAGAAEAPFGAIGTGVELLSVGRADDWVLVGAAGTPLCAEAPTGGGVGSDPFPKM